MGTSVMSEINSEKREDEPGNRLVGEPTANLFHFKTSSGQILWLRVGQYNKGQVKQCARSSTWIAFQRGIHLEVCSIHNRHRDSEGYRVKGELRKPAWFDNWHQSVGSQQMKGVIRGILGSRDGCRVCVGHAASHDDHQTQGVFPKA